MSLPFHAWRPDFVGDHSIFEPFRVMGIDFKNFPEFPNLEQINELHKALKIESCFGPNFRFIPQAPRARRRRLEQESYEQLVFRTGSVPTRSRSWHDLFNALSWMLFPKTKHAIIHRTIEINHKVDQQSAKAGRVRSREQERMAMFDEGGMILINDVVPLIFGHAIWEHAALNDFGTTCLSIPVEVPGTIISLYDGNCIKVVDVILAEKISNGFLEMFESSGVATARYFLC